MELEPETQLQFCLGLGQNTGWHPTSLLGANFTEHTATECQKAPSLPPLQLSVWPVLSYSLRVNEIASAGLTSWKVAWKLGRGYFSLPSPYSLLLPGMLT